jgi:SAM-dependent methyltransferase
MRPKDTKEATWQPRNPPATEEVTACPVCGATHREFQFSNQDRLHGRPGSFALVRCRGCDLIYLSPRPTPEAMSYYYPEDYMPFVERKMPRWLRALVERWGGVARRRRAVERLSPPGRILDVGCATGDFLAGMQKHGWDVHGVEIAPEAAAQASVRLGAPIFSGDMLQANFPNDYFHVVTQWNVLEHLYEPIASLREAYRILKPGGWLILIVPNTESLDFKLFGRSWVGWDTPRHLFLFSPRLLIRTLRQIGFQPGGQECLYGSYSSFVLSLRFLVAERWGAGAGQFVDRWGLNNLTLRALLTPGFYMINSLKKGTMLTVYAKKPGV